MNFFSLSGTILDGRLMVKDPPGEIAYLLPLGQFTDSAFFELADGTEVQITVDHRPRQKSLTLMGDITVVSAAPIVTHNLETLAGWSNVCGVWFSPQELEVFEMSYEITMNGGRWHNLMLLGKSGYGKTTRAGAWAMYKELDHIYNDMSLYKSPEAIFGKGGLVDGEKTVFWPTEFTEFIERGNAVVCMDEMTRILSPAVANSLFPILDDRRATTLNTNEGNIRIECGDHIMFIATANEGHEFTGTVPLDSALRKRFGAFLSVDAPPPDVEMRIVTDRFDIAKYDAQTIIKVLDALRRDDDVLKSDADITTRKAVHVAELVKAGLSIKNAFKFSLTVAAPHGIQKHIDDSIGRIL